MLGFVIGTICLIGLIRVIRRGRGRRWAGACGAGACGGGAGRWGGGFRHGGLRWFYEVLDTTPSQEKVMRAAIEDVRDSTKGAREEMQKARLDLAEALRSEDFNEASVQAAYARLEIEAQQVRDRFVENLKKVHETLDPEQRKRLAAMVSRQGFSPYGGF